MVTNGGTVKATPSALDSTGTAFSVTWHHSSRQSRLVSESSSGTKSRQGHRRRREDRPLRHRLRPKVAPAVLGGRPSAGAVSAGKDASRHDASRNLWLPIDAPWRTLAAMPCARNLPLSKPSRRRLQPSVVVCTTRSTMGTDRRNPDARARGLRSQAAVAPPHRPAPRAARRVDRRTAGFSGAEPRADRQARFDQGAVARPIATTPSSPFEK
jgi:hypothetical protein